MHTVGRRRARALVFVSLVACLQLRLPVAAAWDVAKTPPMGFNTWNLYGCRVDAAILTETATAMVKTGLQDAGYIYVNSDDCWMSFNRSADGRQVPDPVKFPQGFKAVADFIHGLGMKSGLYTAKGPYTCQKRAASCLHEAQDAKTWASWGVDYVKDDSCSTCVMENGTQFSDLSDYSRMWQGIQDSGRPMVLTVEGRPPADVITHGGYGNAKRVGHDIGPSWGSMISLVDVGAGLWPYAHNSKDPTYGGWWNDLDMIEIGNGGHKAEVSDAAGTMYPWAMLPNVAGAGWTMGADGTVKNGGLCLTAQPTIALLGCESSKASVQQFTLETDGNLHLKAKTTSCLALQDGHGPGTVMAGCKQGGEGLNEEFTIVDGQLCSSTLGYTRHAVCLKPRMQKPGAPPSSGFGCIDDAAALARCRVHFTMWTLMKAPLLLGNDIRKMDAVALGVVKNKYALAISQDALGVQAQRVWAKAKASSSTEQVLGGASMAAVAAPCDAARPTQTWRHEGGVLRTTDAHGTLFCLSDVEGTEDVGSWRGVRCSESSAGTTLRQRVTPVQDNTALLTPSGAHLTLNNAHGASGPVAHSRYLTADHDRSPSSTWVLEYMGNDTLSTFKLTASDRVGVRDDDKMGGVKMGGDFCVDLVNDDESEVWAGPLADGKWTVAMLNRDPLANASITLDFTMFNATAESSFSLRDVWQGQDVGVHQGSFTSIVPPQAVTYLILSPARL